MFSRQVSDLLNYPSILFLLSRITDSNCDLNYGIVICYQYTNSAFVNVLPSPPLTRRCLLRQAKGLNLHGISQSLYVTLSLTLVLFSFLLSLLPDSNWRVLTEPEYKSGAINHYAKKANIIAVPTRIELVSPAWQAGRITTTPWDHYNVINPFSKTFVGGARFELARGVLNIHLTLLSVPTVLIRQPPKNNSNHIASWV